jgi:hypothetical protein
MRTHRDGATGDRRSWLRVGRVALGVALFLFLSGGSAQAGLKAVGSVHVGGSWTQRFQETGVGNFDRVQVLMATGGPFELPVTQGGFDAAGWAETCTNTIESSAAGPAATLMQWDIAFQGTPATPLVFFFQAFRGATLLETAYCSWNGSAWVIDDFTPGTASWPGGEACGFGNAVVALEPGTCLTSPAQCATVPVRIIRNDPAQVRAFSITFALSPELALCGTPGASVTQGTYLDSPPFLTDYHVVANLDGTYTVDCAILGPVCGQNQPQGSLFDIRVRGLAEGVGTVTLLSVDLRDCLNGDVFATYGPPIPVNVDYTAPGAVADLAAERMLATGQGTGQIHRIRLTWSGAAGTVSLYRAPFGSTAGSPAGHYPQYDDGFPAMQPPDPLLAPGSPWQLVTTSATSPYDDLPPVRDYWYYVAFVTDACGNLSAVSNRTGGTLDYLLGDVSDGYTPGLGDNRVFTEDISALGASYGVVGAALVDPVGFLDVGPTTNRYVDGRPKPDNVIAFEDLVIFAINYSANVQVPMLAAAATPADRDELTLEVPARVRAGETFAVRLVLAGAGGVQALSAQLGWDAAVAVPLGAEAGDWLAGQGGIVLSSGPGNVDAALLGLRGRALSGVGTLAVVTFRALADGDPRIGLARLAARDAQNQPLALGAPAAGAGAGLSTALMPAMPNPFHGATALGISLAEAGPVEVAVYSVDGRRVKTLFKGNREAGAFRIAWDGTDERGNRMQPGVFFARLVTASGQSMRAVTYLR